MPKHCSETALHKKYGTLEVKQHIGRQQKPKTDMPHCERPHCRFVQNKQKFLSFLKKGVDKFRVRLYDMSRLARANYF